MEKLEEIEKAKEAALKVLLHNMYGPFEGLPRTAGWGYPEPYTRDLLISILGIAVSENRQLLESIRNVLVTLSENQSPHGHIPSLVHDPDDRGASDTTPLFLLAVAIFRKVTGETHFLEDAVQKSLTWMEYQCPSDRYLVGQLPTSDWRDEQWAIGYGLFVNTLTYSYLKLFGNHERANGLRKEMLQFTISDGKIQHHEHEGLVVKHKPYYAFWAYKVYCSERFDLLGNSIAILSGLAPLSRAEEIIAWIEQECIAMQKNGDLAVDLPPNFFPFMRPDDPDWIPRYMHFNLPGEYHNGGIWPFICGFYIAALVAAREYELAEKKLIALTALVRNAENKQLEFGFNEWHKAQDGQVRGQDWQTWSAAMYLYAAKCVEKRRTPFFDELNG
ncbi:MAG TPA: glycoside hydrolase 100 family protein [Mucilaginibacter sp.]